MLPQIKNIRFQQKGDNRAFFDILFLSDIMKLQPTDHSQFENHRLTFFALLFITEGKGEHSINFTEYTFKKGTVFAIGRDSIHKFHASDAKGYLLVFTEDFVLQYLSKENATKMFQLFNEQLASAKQQLHETDFASILPYLYAIRNEFFHIKDGFSAEMTRSLLHIIITQLHRIKSADNTAVFGQTKYLSQFLRFQQLLETHWTEYKKVSFYADKMAITSRTLNNITHSIVHKSAKTVINDLLILKVKRLLINTHINITQIAYETGFYEASHLFKFFKKQTGFSPSQFREQFL
ncbi:MAG: helix-turn-helix transcriptional regulator [Bacteroidota bacterium]